jgi:hypothetical protein
MARDTPIDITGSPELTIGPVIIRMQVADVAPKKKEAPKDGTVLDFDQSGGAAAAWKEQQQKPIAPGAEDAYMRQLQPYIEAYRAAEQRVACHVAVLMAGDSTVGSSSACARVGGKTFYRRVPHRATSDARARCRRILYVGGVWSG